MQGVFDRSGPARLVAGGVWFLSLMIVSGVFWWLSSVVMGRAYGPEGYGIFNTAQSLYNFTWAFVFGGLFQGLIKYGSEYMAKSGWKFGSYFSMALKYLTAIGIIMSILLSILAFYVVDPIMKIMVLSIAVSFLFSGTKDALASMIGSLQKSDHLSIVSSGRSMIVLIAGIIFIILGFPSHLLPVLIVIGTVWQLMLSTYFLRSHLRKLIPFVTDELFHSKKKFGFLDDFKHFSKIFVFGFFVSLGITSFNIMKSLDIVVLNMFFDFTGVGVYSVADTASSILFYMTSFSLPIIPAIAEAYAKKDRKLLEEYVEIAVKYPLIIGVPLTVIIMTMAQPLILGIYGAAFAGAVEPLQILILGTFMLMFGYNLSSILIGVGKARLAGGLMAAAAIQYIISLFIFVPLFGFVGAALALTLTGLTSMLLVPYYLKKELQVSVYGGLPKVFLSASIMTVVILLMPKTNPFFMALGVVGSVALFIALLRLFGYITWEDLKMMKTTGKSFTGKRRFKKKR